MAKEHRTLILDGSGAAAKMYKYIRISGPLTSRMDMSYTSGNGSLLG